MVKRPVGSSLAPMTKRLKDYQEYHGAPLPSGLASVSEAPVLQQTANHKEALLDELNLYETQDITTQILESYNYEVPQSTAPMHQAPIEFKRHSGTDQYIDLSRSTLCVECRILNPDNTAIAADLAVAPINNVLHSLFSNIEVFVNHTKVSQPHNLYPFVAFLGQLTSFEPDVLKNLKAESEGWYQDTPGKINTAAAENAGWEERRKMFAKSRKVQLEGRPFVPIFIQEKLIPGNVPIQIRLFPSKDEFVLHHSGANESNKNFKMEICSAKLRINVKKVSPTLLATHAAALAQEPFRYKHTEIWPKMHALAQGSTNVNIHNIFDGKLPDAIALAMVDSNALNGSYLTSPFHFQNADALSMQLEANGTMIPAQQIETDFTATNTRAIHAYMQVMREFGIAFSNSAPALTYQSWLNGGTVYYFNISHNPEEENVKAPARQGSVTVKGSLQNATTATMSVIMIAEYKSRWMELNLYRQASA